MMERILRRPRGDRGAMLVLAIIVITVVAVVTGVVLTRGDGSLRATVALRDVARTSYAADAAAQVAVNALRTGYNTGNGEPDPWYYTNVSGTGCFGYDGVAPNTTAIDSLVMNGLIPKASGETQQAMSARVECTPDDATGAQGSAVPINSQNKPGYAIVTLNGPLTTADTLKVHGGVYSNSTISGPVSLDAGDAWAFGACAQTTVTAPATKHCNSGQKISDPNYSNDLGGVVPALRTPPTSCTGGVAVFQPGYYDNASQLNAATTLCSVAWFKPGTYYFDFHDGTCANVCPDNLYAGSTNVWNINGATVVGGTPTNASGAVIASPPTNPTFPGSCQSPITDTSAVGVQFVFGNDSQIYIDQNSRVELCGSYHADRPPIELYGLKTGSTPSAANANGLTAGSVPTPGAFTGASAGNLAAADGTAATWTTTNASTQTTTLTARGFAPGTSIPAGSVLTSATLKVVHQDASNAATSRPTLTVKFPGAASASAPAPALTASPSMVTDTITFNSTTNGAIFNALQKEVHDNGYSGGLDVAYTANMKQIGSDRLDALTLDLTYYVPVLRGQGGTCIDGTGSSCQFLSMKNGNNKILFYLQGTTYVPYADVAIQLGNFSAEVAKFGIVTRQLEFAITNGNPSWTGPIFEIPDNSPGFGFETTLVRLEVYVCPGASCATGGELALKSKVRIFDEGGTPGPPNREVSVLSWSHTR